ncbi:MAG: ABC transporter permease [Clostridia bacterium]|nr:ABC transporter permease [Clostridia bacterium]
MRSLKRVYAFAVRNIKETIREPLTLIFMFAFPLFMVALFYSLFHSAAPQFTMAKLAPGMMVFGQAFITLFLGILIATDRASSFVIRLYTTELKPMEFLAGYELSMVPVALLQAVLIMAEAMIIDPSFASWNVLPAIIIGLIPAKLFLSFGVLFGSFCTEKTVGGVSSIVITAQSMLSGMWYPPEGLSGAFVTLMDVLPFKNATLAVSSVATGDVSVENTLIPALIVLGYAVAIWIAAVFIYRRKMIQ